MRDINYLVVHCSATSPDIELDASDIRRWHLSRGWSDIGYHIVIRLDGTIERGRSIEKVGAHVLGHNTDSIGICLIGGVDDNLQSQNNFTAPQFASLRLVLDGFKRRFPNAVIQGHRDFPGVAKACPSFDVKEWLDILDDWRA